jgi:hypothetical protein
MARLMARRSGMPMPIPWTEGATRSTSWLRPLLILVAVIAVGVVVAWWLRHQHMSQLRLFTLGLLVVALLVWAGKHRRDGRRLVVVAIEWALPFALAVALLGTTGAHPGKPAPHDKAGKQTTAREQPSPATLQKSAANYCRKIQPCRDLLDWYDKRLGSDSAKGGKPAGKSADRAKR